MTTTIECQMKHCIHIIDKKFCGKPRVKLIRRGYSLYCALYKLDKQAFVETIKREMMIE